MKHVQVVAAVRSRKIDGVRKYWVCQRDDSGHHPALVGLWEYPGGKVEVGESIYAALIREMKEEFGVNALVGKVLATITGSIEGDECLYDVHFIECAFHGTPKLTCHTETKWCTVEELSLDKHLPSGTIFNGRLQMAKGLR